MIDHIGVRIADIAATSAINVAALLMLGGIRDRFGMYLEAIGHLESIDDDLHHRL